MLIDVHALVKVLMPGTGVTFETYEGQWQEWLLWAWVVAAVLVVIQSLLYWIAPRGYSSWASDPAAPADPAAMRP